jgi:hypothetical protein
MYVLQREPFPAPSLKTVRKNTMVKIKVKVTHVQAMRLCTSRTAHRGSRGIAIPIHDHGTRTGEGSASRPGRSLPPGKTRYPLYRRLGGTQGRSGQVRKISPPLEFDPWTVQPVASCYTDWATRPTRTQYWLQYTHLKSVDLVPRQIWITESTALPAIMENGLCRFGQEKMRAL